MNKILVLISILIFFSFSCSLKKPATAVTADVLASGMPSIEAEEDLFVARETALPLIKVLDVFHYGDEHNKKLLGLLAKAYGNYAFGFGELEMLKTVTYGNPGHSISEWPDRVKRFYLKGRDYGIKALSSGKNNVATMPMPKFQQYLKKFGKKDIQSLFWTAFNWGSYINMNRTDIVEAANLPLVEAMIDRVLEIDPDFNCGVAYAFKGAIIACNPLRNGGKPETAKPYFEKAIVSCDSKYLMNKVMYAEWYGGNTDEKDIIKKELDEVLAADAAALPSQRLANELAKERAELLMMMHD